MITEFLTNNFGLPDGGLYSNLIASAILGGAGFVYGRAFEKRAIDRHQEQMSQKSIHHQEMLDKIKELHNHIEKVRNDGSK